MILVNLLPQQLRLKETRRINIPYKPIVAGIFLIFLIFALYNLFLYVRVREEHRGLQRQWSSLAEQSAKADLLERELGVTILAEVEFYDALVDPNLEAAKVLNLISDLIPKSVWLTQLKFVRAQKEMQLVLNGLSESTGKSSKLIEIQNFANKLKDEMEKVIGPVSAVGPGVNKQIKVAVTTSSQKGEVGKAEVTQFAATFETDGFKQK